LLLLLGDEVLLMERLLMFPKEGLRGDEEEV
jgi:hypothetical protein